LLLFSAGLHQLLLVSDHAVGPAGDFCSELAFGASRGLGLHGEFTWKHLEQHVELDKPGLEVLVLNDLESDANYVTVDAVRVEYRVHRQQVLEELSMLAVVCQLNVAVLALGERVSDHSNRLGLDFWPLEETAVAAACLL